jgi:hypothetical protein
MYNIVPLYFNDMCSCVHLRVRERINSVWRRKLEFVGVKNKRLVIFGCVVAYDSLEI